MNYEKMRARIKKLRKEALAIREKAADKEKKNERIRNVILDLMSQNIRRVFVFASYRDEADTRMLMKALLEKDIPVFCPKVEGTAMTFYQILSLDSLKEGYKGIPEPDVDQDLEAGFPAPDDIMLVPGLLFDINGGRIGYGGGYYDRYLKEHPCLKAGLCFSDQLHKEPLPQMPWDVKMDLVISDKGLIKTGKEIEC